MAKPVFQVLMNLLVLDRASSACGKVFRRSQSALSECKGLGDFLPLHD